VTRAFYYARGASVCVRAVNIFEIIATYVVKILRRLLRDGSFRFRLMNHRVKVCLYARRVNIRRKRFVGYVLKE